jgi:hypothetical protein
MKKLVVVITVFFIVSCNNFIEKPNNLIDEDQMVEIIYDISLLDAMKSQGVTTQTSYPTTSQFLKSKYKVDSITFAKSSQYYAADYKKYKKMYEEVKKRLEEDTKKINGGNLVTPNPDQGIVK